LANLALPENSKFGTEQAQQYMNPYIQQALDPQLEYMRRQAAINQQGDMAKLAQVGAFGGSRQAVLQGLNQEALMRQQATTTGAGYEKAYNAAMAQFNSDQGNQRSNLNALSTAGGTQQEQEQAALDASYKDWLRQTKYPGEQLEQQKGIITAMAGVTPQTKTLYQEKDPTAQTIASGITMGKDMLSALGIKDMEGLKTAAAKFGVPVDKLASVFGFGGPDTSNPASTGQTGLPSSETGGGYTPDDQGRSAPPPGYHRDAAGNLVMDDIYTTMPVGPDFTIPDDYEGDFGDYAQGGLIDLLHKMRSHK
jgi:hypothetical protein